MYQRPTRWATAITHDHTRSGDPSSHCGGVTCPHPAAASEPDRSAVGVGCRLFGLGVRPRLGGNLSTRGNNQATRPMLRAMATACIRLPARSFWLMLRRCVRTVDSETNSCVAIRSLENPQAKSSRTWRSFRVRAPERGWVTAAANDLAAIGLNLSQARSHWSRSEARRSESPSTWAVCKAFARALSVTFNRRSASMASATRFINGGDRRSLTFGPEVLPSLRDAGRARASWLRRPTGPHVGRASSPRRPQDRPMASIRILITDGESRPSQCRAQGKKRPRHYSSGGLKASSWRKGGPRQTRVLAPATPRSTALVQRRPQPERRPRARLPIPRSLRPVQRPR